ncbi:hypothetical protein ACFSCW_12025 [Sphingomonas tabacisoli]|uniref:Uncharacterized protein n=1 Tax=Sphingomonas tabacisoli TaxID=2249466 RepID=A0ABW4I518_9SPHN
MADDEIHRTATEARAASKPGVVRYILSAALVLVVLGFILAYFVGR